MDSNNIDTNALSKMSLPKRLAALLVFLVLISIIGLIMKQGVLLCILTLFMVLAIIGKQKSALIMLRVYTSLQLTIISMLPLVLYDPDNLTSSVAIGSLKAQIPDWILFSILILLSIIQVWIAFTRKVGQYFNREVNLNIMR